MCSNTEFVKKTTFLNIKKQTLKHILVVTVIISQVDKLHSCLPVYIYECLKLNCSNWLVFF